MYPARSMCGTSYQVAGLNSTSSGTTEVTVPSGPSVNPAGWFIHALAAITENVPPIPAIATGIPVAKCAQGDRRSQP